MRELLDVTSLRVASRSLPVMAGGILAAIGLFFVVLCLVLGWTELRYRNEGERAEARVVWRSPPGDRHPRVRYRFSHRPSTLTVDREEDVAKDLWGRLAEGSAVEIEYLADDIGSARILRVHETRFAIAFVLAVGSGMLVAGGLVMRRGLREVVALRRLADSGTEVEGTITSIQDSALRINGVAQRVIVFAFRGGDGKEYEARSWPMDPEQTRRWSAGDRGPVRYDPAKPDRALWAGTPPRRERGKRGRR